MIESPRNDRFKSLLRLTEAKGLRETGLFLLSGAKLVHEFLVDPFLAIDAEIRTSSMASVSPSSEQVILSGDLFHEIDVLGTHFPLLCLKQPPLSAITAAELAAHRPEGIEVVAPLGDPQNLGALIRTAEGFGVGRVFLTQESAHPFLPRSVRASAGSVLRMKMSRGPALREFPKTALALDKSGAPIDHLAKVDAVLLVIGEEGRGFGDAEFEKRVSVPTQRIESLNVVVAAGIALFCLTRGS